jgi:hypothetical protein
MNRRNEQGNASIAFAALCLVVIFVGSILALDGCDARTDRAATLARAEAQAYAERQAADTAAASERAAIREAARQAGHERALEWIPVLLVITAVVLAVIVGGVIAFQIVSRPRPAAQVPPQIPQIIVIGGGGPRPALDNIPQEAWPLLATAISQAQRGREIVIHERRD